MGTSTLSGLRDQVEQVLHDPTNATYSTGEIDAAIRRALADLTAHAPARDLAAPEITAGRMISLAALTGLITVERVWWMTSFSDYPPQWVAFEMWPQNTLYINDTREPQDGDTLLVFYTCAHTLSGLDSASSTTFPDDQAALIVTGAAGYTAQSHAVELAEQATVDGWPQQRLLDYADQQLRAFRDGLKTLARQQAARASGIASAPALDRWDTGTW